MGYQSGLPVDNPAYPEQLHDEEQDRVYHFLGVDEDGYGHYWLGSDLLNSEVVRVDEDYSVEGRENWLSKNQVSDYVLNQDLRDLSDLSKMHLEESGD